LELELELELELDMELDMEMEMEMELGNMTKGARLNPEEFPLTTKRALEASKRGLDPQETYEGFCDYWVSLPGVKATKLDWDATWRNRCRDLALRLKPWERPQAKTSADLVDMAAIAALEARRAPMQIGEFRLHNDGETASDYRRAQDDYHTKKFERPRVFKVVR